VITKLVKVAPSILSANQLRIVESIRQIEKAGADLVHIDIIDGVFAPNLSFGPRFVKDLDAFTKLPLDIHMMIVNPLRFVSSFAEAGADYISVHIEALDESSAKAFLKMSTEFNFSPGFALRPSSTEPSWLNSLLSDVKMVVPMSVEPGFSGQKFLPKTIVRIKKFQKIKNSLGLHYEIEADGGVNFENAALLYKNGVNILVAGSAVFDSHNISEAIKKLKATEARIVE
jgi:ribulose-phosphate 3-epimerase